ncbi:Alpha/Beta hydrolase protein [Fusarium sp. MPI-SDFR-AT-0072]|nr:Alpha/Beta hydrolase protein [Fusarium sp. MPI-SDFR-AT-0072]
MAIPINAIRPYRHLVRYAEWAYDNNNGTRFRSHLQDNELKGAPLHARKLQSNTSGSHNHVHLGIRHGNTLVMAFRGTDVPTNLENFAQSERWVGLAVNLLTDICYGLREPSWITGENVLVHDGFLRDFDRLESNLSHRIDSLFNGQSLNGIEVCGHSLGGALATLCALWCSIRWPMVPITCLTIGSPKVGDTGFAQAFRRRNNITCYRLVIPSDPVPKVPNRTTEKIPFRISPDARWYFKWKDSGTPTWEHVGQMLQLSGGPRGPRRLVKVWGLFPLSLSSHSPWGYVVTVQNMLGL